MTYYADVSEWQTGINDTYPYRMVCIRSNDGTYRDQKWANNYGWCKRASDDGRLDCFLVYMVYRTNWQQTLDTFKSMVGTPHPKLIAMLDLESWGGQIGGNQSAGINALIDGLAQFLGDRRRVVAYGNQGDLNSLWPSKPADTRLVVAGYSMTKPAYRNQIAWQYTDGQGYGPGPQGCAPFGNCDMNQTDFTPSEFAAECGTTGGFLMSLDDSKQNTVWSAGAQVDGPSLVVRKAPGWLAKFLPKSFRDPKGVWVRDEIDAIVNEVVSGVFSFHPDDTIDFEDGNGPTRLVDVDPHTPVNFTTLLRIVAARQVQAEGSK